MNLNISSSAQRPLQTPVDSKIMGSTANSSLNSRISNFGTRVLGALNKSSSKDNTISSEPPKNQSKLLLQSRALADNLIAKGNSPTFMSRTGTIYKLTPEELKTRKTSNDQAPAVEIPKKNRTLAETARLLVEKQALSKANKERVLVEQGFLNLEDLQGKVRSIPSSNSNF